MTLPEFNLLEKEAAASMLMGCCGSSNWVKNMMLSFPYKNEQHLVEMAVTSWYDNCKETDWLEAFTHHPEIGDVKMLQEKFASTRHLAGNEQLSVNAASMETLTALSEANKAYKKSFGFIFIVCATGKSAEEMLQLLKDRLKNATTEELHIAMGEQFKITLLRLKKILENADWKSIQNGHLTTHVLDTSMGKPGKNISIKLQQSIQEKWVTIAQGITNEDGRIPDLIAPSRKLPVGVYKMIFDTESYFNSINKEGFYPQVDIQFYIKDGSHYHVPLLINPFGYSTYRGS